MRNNNLYCVGAWYRGAACRLSIRLTLILLLLAPVSAHSQPSTSGKDFWLAFGSNFYVNIGDLLQIRIVTEKNTQVTIAFTETGEVVSLSLPAGTVYTYHLTEEQVMAVYCTNIIGTETSSKSIHIQADQPVSVYAIDMYCYTTAVTGVLPTSALGVSYYNLSYMPAFMDGYTIVSPENNTTIYENGIAIAVLNKGEVYSSYFPVDGTGKHITSDHPVAHFVTCYSASVPTVGDAYKRFYQQLYAESFWGNRFFVPVTVRGIERVRIIASQDNTIINLTGGTLISGSFILNAGEWTEIEIYGSQNGCYIETSNPVGVASYLVRRGYPGLTSNYGCSNMAWIPPVEQSVNETLFASCLAVYPISQISRYYVLIVAPTSAKNQTEMMRGNGDYTALTGGVWYDHPSGYSYYSLRLDDSDVQYGLKNPEGLVVLAYGTGDWESYYYVASSATLKLDACFEVNGIHFQSLEGKTFCDDEIEVKATVNHPLDNAPGSLRWLVDGVEQTAFTDSLQWKGRLTEGERTVSMIASQYGGILDTVTASFIKGENKERIINDAICQNESYDKHGFSFPAYTAAGVFNYRLDTVTALGCDSVVLLNITVNPVYNDLPVTANICQGERIFFGKQYYKTTGIYMDTLKTVFGCDSTVTLHLAVNPTHDMTFTDRVPVNEPYAANGFFVPPQSKLGRITIKENHDNAYGCDSTITLYLTVYAEIFPDKSFSPNGDGVNDVWKIKNIEYFEVISIDIYDRFGKLLVRNIDRFTPWDGNYLGNPMLSTDYWYTITLKEKTKVHTGHFTLIR